MHSFACEFIDVCSRHDLCRHSLNAVSLTIYDNLLTHSYQNTWVEKRLLLQSEAKFTSGNCNTFKLDFEISHLITDYCNRLGPCTILITTERKSWHACKIVSFKFASIITIARLVHRCLLCLILCNPLLDCVIHTVQMFGDYRWK